MLPMRIRSDIAEATVNLPKKNGQGVLVAGNLILTAAHSIDWDSDNPMVLGDHFTVEINTSKGPLRATPLAIDPVSDMAALGSLDNLKEEIKFDEFCENTNVIPLCYDDFPVGQPFVVYVYTHKKKWVKGIAKQCEKDAQCFFIETEDKIEGGTSGGPIVNEAGELVSIVSLFGDQSDEHCKCEGPNPRPHLTLPNWVLNKIARNRAQDV